MGDNLEADRTTWDAGPTDQGAGTSQLDMSVLGGSANGFGLQGTTTMATRWRRPTH